MLGRRLNLKKIHKGCNFCDILPVSERKVFKRNSIDDSKNAENDFETRVNEVNIQMLSKNLFDQLFKSTSSPDSELIQRCQADLKKHGIDFNLCDRLPNVVLDLPKLHENDIEDHFMHTSREQVDSYMELMKTLINEGIPPKPDVWLKKPGWYCYKTGTAPEKISYPPCNAMIFDVEVLMCAGTQPTLACAVSTDAWYGWTSDSLFDPTKVQIAKNIMEYDALIPLESNVNDARAQPNRARIVIGHNVSYDRAKVKEQYLLQKSGLRFMDTMSMHVCVSGVTSYQRAVLKSKEKNPEKELDQDWMDISSLNSLQEVHKLYCGHKIAKEPRNIFVEGTRDDVITNFNHLMDYCAGDVMATYRVFVELYPMFLERFPHPATLAGMLELGTAYLPVNSNWLRYIESSETAFEESKLETRQLLSIKADNACRLMNNEAYKRDLWMWDQDWSTQKLKLKKVSLKVTNDCHSIPTISDKSDEMNIFTDEAVTLNDDIIDRLNLNYVKSDIDVSELEKTFSHLYELGKYLPAKRPLLPGYPAWYRKLCTKADGTDAKWTPGANNVTTSMQITPKLLNLSWEGYPLHHIKDEGWGFLVPFSHRRPVDFYEEPQIPLEELLVKCPVTEFDVSARQDESALAFSQLDKNVQKELGKRTYYASKKQTDNTSKYSGLGVWCNVELEGCVHFLRLPHKDGPKNKVGNPLARDFLDKFSQNVLTAKGNEAEKVLMFARMMSYWRNNRERITNQQVVWIPERLLPEQMRATSKKYGAILPQVVVCGTLTRRAMEPTWMTASNAHPERIGSELRAMVQAPPGYTFVGADVDSQELWIASLLGDASVQLFGGTPFGWAVLAGSKQNKTDLHSLSAKSANISRDHAKVINYARIYGAGQSFAERLLKQFNPTISNAEAKHKAMKMFKSTKGTRIYKLKEEYLKGFDEEDSGFVEMSAYQAMRLAKLSGRNVSDMFERPKWVGGTESEMFNRLEEVSEKENPRTAFLEGRLSRALENDEGRWSSTKLNWAVQSAAADFLHLMLVSMKWLNHNSVRFSLSFHDEVRYLVPEQLKYEAALSLHLTNLYTRAFCTKRVGLSDLPMSVAFFSSVEIDKAMRKEANMDCVTPSNPHGMDKSYNILPGESLSIYDVIKVVNKIQR